MQTTEKLHNAESHIEEPVSRAALKVVPPPGYQPQAISLSVASALKLPSERRFGLMLTVAFAILGSYGIFRHRSWIANVTCLVASGVFGLLTLAIPRILVPLNRAWFHLSELLGKIVNPIVLGIIFFGILTPISLVTRLFGRDELRLKRRAVQSYWVDRDQTDSASHSFKNQF